MVSFLDLHVSTPDASEQHGPPPLEILEAGTGHGALTLFIARAIHAANPYMSPEIRSQLVNERITLSSSKPVKAPKTSFFSPLTSWLSSLHLRHSTVPLDTPNADTLLDWRSRRRAVVHTLDVSSAHSEHAQRIVFGFRQGIYAGDVEFNVGDASQWIDQQKDSRDLNSKAEAENTFLSHVILDLPSSHTHVAKATSALHIDGVLMAFNPSITQITACVELIRQLKLPLVLERVVELGVGMTGGRQWDVRAVKPRAVAKREKETKQARIDGQFGDERMSRTEEEKLEDSLFPTFQTGDVIDSAITLDKEDVGLEMVCRPKVGDRLVGGGFLGVWKKMRRREPLTANTRS